MRNAIGRRRLREKEPTSVGLALAQRPSRYASPLRRSTPCAPYNVTLSSWFFSTGKRAEGRNDCHKRVHGPKGKTHPCAPLPRLARWVASAYRQHPKYGRCHWYHEDLVNEHAYDAEGETPTCK